MSPSLRSELIGNESSSGVITSLLPRLTAFAVTCEISSLSSLTFLSDTQLSFSVVRKILHPWSSPIFILRRLLLEVDGDANDTLNNNSPGTCSVLPCEPGTQSSVALMRRNATLCSPQL